MCANGVQFGLNRQQKDNTSEFIQTLKHNFEQREKGYRIRLDALSTASEVLRLRDDSLTARHRTLVRENAILKNELKTVAGRFDKLSAAEVRIKMIEEYNKSK